MLAAEGLHGQSFRLAGTEFDVRRTVTVPSEGSYPIVVTEFYCHGALAPDGRNLVVAASNRELVPWRILQLGPGDFCRLAFQTVANQQYYEIFYGGEPPSEVSPPWTGRDGLLLETRRYKDCNLNSLESVRDAFDASTPYGSDYVENVYHSCNPFWPQPEPFLSRYTGYLHIATAGTYGFLTSSQDCSFLLIDGKEVVSAPGRHGRMTQALRGSRKDVPLAAGPHRFEYHHAATGPGAVMVAVWEVSPTDPKPQPTLIPPEVFRTRSVGRLPVGSPTLRTRRAIPDFAVEIMGDVPLPDNEWALIGVSFRDTSPQALTMQSKVLWEFGDGQTSDKLKTDHVYLRPGLYTVKLTLKRGTRGIEVANRVMIDRPLLTAKDQQKLHKLDDYLPILRTYDPHTLAAASLRQLVLAYEAKAAALQAPPDEEPAEEDPAATPVAPPPVDVRPLLTEAVAAGKVAFLGESAAHDAAELHKLARLVGPMARDRLGDSELALQIWQGAAGRIDVDVLRAECEIEAADVAVNDLLDAPAAKRLLDAAAARLGAVPTGPVPSKRQRVLGDCLAAGGDGPAAQKAYEQAERILGTNRDLQQRTAWRGAHSRSAEAFIKEGQFDRAAEQLHQWQDEFPSETLDGYLTLMYARYWAGRGKYAQAIAQAERLQAVSPDSPYVDLLLLLAAECEEKRGRVDRALATLHALLKEHPGSPLVPEVKQRITQWEK